MWYNGQTYLKTSSAQTSTNCIILALWHSTKPEDGGLWRGARTAAASACAVVSLPTVARRVVIAAVSAALSWWRQAGVRAVSVLQNLCN